MSVHIDVAVARRADRAPQETRLTRAVINKLKGYRFQLVEGEVVSERSVDAS